MDTRLTRPQRVAIFQGLLEAVVPRDRRTHPLQLRRQRSVTRKRNGRSDGHGRCQHARCDESPRNPNPADPPSHGLAAPPFALLLLSDLDTETPAGATSAHAATVNKSNLFRV